MKSKLTTLIIAILIMACNSSNQQKNNYENEIDALIAQMTLEEKVGMIHAKSSFTSAGVERLGIPDLVMSDGPYGVRIEHGHDWEPDGTNDSATYLPTSITLAATWNENLAYEFGKVLGSEANERGKNVILGPGLNIQRTPLCGRNFEYLSEDPYLTSKIGVAYIKGVQSQDVAACAKHYIANNQEIERNKINVEMSERALHEIYLPAFKAAVQEADVLTVMGAYNKFRGEYCSHNKFLINKLLKEEIGFSGALISDWAAVHNTMDAIFKGTDIEMGTDLDQLPNPDYSKFYLGDTVIRLVENGQVPESVIDDKVRRILRVMFSTKMIGEEKSLRKKGERNSTEHQQLALKVAEEGIVLLKNENVLPLNKNEIKKVAVIGANATQKNAIWGGSAQVQPPYEITPFEGIKNLLGENTEVNYAPGYLITKNNKVDNNLFIEAGKLAREADVTIFVGGWTHNYGDKNWSTNIYDSEGKDKPNIDMPFGQNNLIKTLLAINPNTIIVLIGGGPVDMTEWVNHAKGIIQAWYPGMEGGTAIAKILFGETNPSGKLPLTFPKKLEDHPAHKLGEYPGENLEVHYNEGIYVGYRYFDTYNTEPLFCFGHGLSYTNFEYTNITVSPGNENAKLTFEIKNTGEMAGAEVAQVYVSDLKSKLFRPFKELKAFKKVFLNPNESQLVEIELNKNAFQYFDDEEMKWIFESGEFEILVGSSSGDIKLKNKINL